MQCFYSAQQHQHAPPSMIIRGKLSPSPEGPIRADILRQGVENAGLSLTDSNLHNGEDRHKLHQRLLQIHTPRYLHFLEHIFQQWSELPNASDSVIPNVHPCVRAEQYPQHPVGLAGWHQSDMACPIGATSFSGILASASTAQAAAEAVIAGAQQAYALCRPPGHHAASEQAGGFCYLNNAALAATVLRERYAKVAIIDVDLHHGNGTQSIFYHRRDVWTGSVHANTADFYPFFWGSAAETGEGEGQGFNVNLPLAIGADGNTFMQALEALLHTMQDFKPDALVIALGLDAHKHDPLAGLTLDTEDFQRIGTCLSQIQLPSVLVQEGGYPTDYLGQNLTAFLQGYCDR